MRRLREDGPHPGFEQRVIAASMARASFHRAAYEELRLVNSDLAAQTARLAAAIESRLSPRRTE